MNRAFPVAILVLSVAAAGSAAAQQGDTTVVQTEPGQSTVVITASPAHSTAGQGYPVSSIGYTNGALEDANAGVRNTRNALIATSALAAVGMIVGATAMRHCRWWPSFYDANDLLCTQRGDALLTAGASIFGLAAIGMITSGIMLGVRKGKRRRLRREMQTRPYGARLQWNTESSRLEF